MTTQPDINIQAPRLDRAIAPSNGIPFTPYTYRGTEPWTPKKSR